MRTMFMLVSAAGLLLVIVAPLMYLAGAVDKSTMNTAMLTGTLLWFGSVSFWMGRKAG